jgi:hypothetical protein
VVLDTREKEKAMKLMFKIKFPFTGNGSDRRAIVVYEVKDGSQLPALGEPWFLTFNAQIEYDLAITPEELGKAGLDELIKKWA